MTLKTRRRQFLFALSALALVACGGGDTGPTGNEKDLVDMAMGPETAPAVVVEYASSVCPACAGYHATMHETIEELTAAGTLRYVFREFPRDQVDIAGFATARCAGDDKYFDVLGDLFENQRGVLAAARNGRVRGALQAIASRHGVDAAMFEACLADEEIRTAISNAAKFGDSQGVGATPTLFFNGAETNEARTPESLIALVEAVQ